MAKQKTKTGYSANKLPYVRIGTGPKKLVVFEGLNFSHKVPSGMNLKMYTRMFKKFPSDYSVYIVGRKPNLPDGYTMRDMSHDYAVMVRDEIGPAHIAGLSTGGPAALWFVIDHRDLTRKLVLISTGYGLSDYGRKVQARMLKAARKGSKRKTAAATAALFSQGFKGVLIKVLLWLIGPVMYDKGNSLSDGIAELDAEDKFDFKDRLADIKVPVLVMGGTGDPLYPIRETAEAIPEAKLKLYESTGHIAPSGKEFINDLVDFLED